MDANSIVDFPPAGYRLATITEFTRRKHPAYFARMVWVRGASLPAVLYIRDFRHG